MKTIYMYTRKHDGEKYDFYANIPSYKGEKGILGLELSPYVSVETPPNCFGYYDLILLSNGKAYSLNRTHPRWIMKRIEKQMITLQEKIARQYYIEEGKKMQAKLAFYND